jgi:WD40 repeat protein
MHPVSRGLWTVDISHDDKYIALGGDDSLLRIFNIDLKLYKSVKTETKGMIRAVSWHPKENLLAIASRNGIWIFDPETGKETMLEGNYNGSRTIGWNYNGEQFKRQMKMVRRIRKIFLVLTGIHQKILSLQLAMK